MMENRSERDLLLSRCLAALAMLNWSELTHFVEHLETRLLGERPLTLKLIRPSATKPRRRGA